MRRPNRRQTTSREIAPRDRRPADDHVARRLSRSPGEAGTRLPRQVPRWIASGGLPANGGSGDTGMKLRPFVRFVLVCLLAGRAAGQAIIWSSGSPFPGELWGRFGLSHVGDTDGDGSSDLAVTSGAISVASGRVSIVSGDDGAIRWSTTGDSAVNSLSIAAIGDVDGDGLDDVVVGDPAFPLPPTPCVGQGRVRVLAGPDGSLIYSLL